MMLLNDVCFVLRVTPLYPFSLVICTNCTNQLYKKTCGQFNKRLLLWQPSGVYLYSTVIILIICPIAIAYSYGTDNKISLRLSVCVCVCLSVCPCVITLTVAFLCRFSPNLTQMCNCLLYTSDAADE